MCCIRLEQTKGELGCLGSFPPFTIPSAPGNHPYSGQDPTSLVPALNPVGGIGASLCAIRWDWGAGSHWGELFWALGHSQEAPSSPTTRNGGSRAPSTVSSPRRSQCLRRESVLEMPVTSQLVSLLVCGWLCGTLEELGAPALSEFYGFDQVPPPHPTPLLPLLQPGDRTIWVLHGSDLCPQAQSCLKGHIRPILPQPLLPPPAALDCLPWL